MSSIYDRKLTISVRFVLTLISRLNWFFHRLIDWLIVQNRNSISQSTVRRYALHCAVLAQLRYLTGWKISPIPIGRKPPRWASRVGARQEAAKFGPPTSHAASVLCVSVPIDRIESFLQCVTAAPLATAKAGRKRQDARVSARQTGSSSKLQISVPLRTVFRKTMPRKSSSNHFHLSPCTVSHLVIF